MNLLYYSVHLLIYFLVSCWQSVSWRITGIHKHLQNCQDGKNYETSAQLKKVLFTPRTLKTMAIVQRRNFITSHVCFLHPEYALQKHIVLLTVSKAHAIFCVPPKHVDVYDTRKFPFLFISALFAAEYLLVVPIASFNRLAESMPDNKAKVLWIYHTGRCGSTALAQAFNSLPDALTISEPYSYVSLLHTFNDGKYNLKMNEKFRRLFRNVVRVSLKPSLKPADIIAVKYSPVNALPNIDLLTELFPEFKVIFMYRDMKPAVMSLYRATKGLELASTITGYVASNSILSTLFPSVRPMRIEYYRCHSTKEHAEWLYSRHQTKPVDMFMQCVIGYAETCHHYRDFVEREKSKILAFKYEILMADMKQQLSALFQFCELAFTEERWSLLQEALGSDSQGQSEISRAEASKRNVQITPEMISDANRVAKFLKLPNWDEPIVLPNTIH